MSVAHHRTDTHDAMSKANLEFIVDMYTPPGYHFTSAALQLTDGHRANIEVVGADFTHFRHNVDVATRTAFKLHDKVCHATSAGNVNFLTFDDKHFSAFLTSL